MYILKLCFCFNFFGWRFQSPLMLRLLLCQLNGLSALLRDHVLLLHHGHVDALLFLLGQRILCRCEGLFWNTSKFQTVLSVLVVRQHAFGVELKDLLCCGPKQSDGERHCDTFALLERVELLFAPLALYLLLSVVVGNVRMDLGKHAPQQP